MCDHPDLREVPLSEKEMFHGVLIDVTHMQVRLPNGQTALREVVRHKGAAAVVPVDDEGNVYLVRQHRVVVDLMTLEIPAGKLDYVGEDPPRLRAPRAGGGNGPARREDGKAHACGDHAGLLHRANRPVPGHGAEPA